MKGGSGRWGRGTGRAAPVYGFFFAVSLLASWSGLSAESSQPVSQQAATSAISATELARLSEISTRLATLNERLRIDLESSRSSLRGLEDSLASSTLELATLRLELEESRRNSSELATVAERSAQESTALREALTRADGSLRSLEASFAAYKTEAESRILRLSATRLGFAALGGLGWLVAVLALALR